MLTRLELRYKEDLRLEVFDTMPFRVFQICEMRILNNIFTFLISSQSSLITEIC